MCSFSFSFSIECSLHRIPFSVNLNLVKITFAIVSFESGGGGGGACDVVCGTLINLSHFHESFLHLLSISELLPCLHPTLFLGGLHENKNKTINNTRTTKTLAGASNKKKKKTKKNNTTFIRTSAKILFGSLYLNNYIIGKTTTNSNNNNKITEVSIEKDYSERERGTSKIGE